MAKKKNTRRRPTKTNNGGNGGSVYELTREQRIKENQERMQKLGLLKLTLKPSPPPPPPPRKRKQPKPPLQSSSPRRSSRLKTDGKENVNVENFETNDVNQDTESEDTEPEPEVYTEEHVKLLGDCKTSWELRVDGFDEDGNRITHSSEGKCCHHCRYKIAGHITECSKCKSILGQLCGDCLYTRYGENVMEANENTDWVCPVCRGICNCSVCRRAKGWKPTGTAITYTKVTSIGYKSVAHYLIQTRGPNSGEAGASPLSREKSLLKLAVKKTGSRKVSRKQHDRKHTNSDSEADDDEEEEEEEDEDDVDLNEDADDYDYEPEENDEAVVDELADGLVIESECLV